RSCPLLGDVLDVVAASRSDVTDTVRTARALDAALEEAGRLGAMLEPDDSTSELRRLNEEAAEGSFLCTDDLFAVLESAKELAAETDGAYDPTAGALARLWSGRGGREEPERADVSDARGAVGWRMLLLDPERRGVRFTRPGPVVAPGSAATGYVLDRAAETLRRHGVVRAKLAIGDEVLAFTTREAWPVRLPGLDGRPAICIALSNAACAIAAAGTAGVPAVIDPRTGQTVRGRVAVTVVARTASRAGPLAAALLVLGRDAATAYARTHPETGVLWLEPAGDPESVRAWAWNLGAIEPEPGMRVEWMARP
ncbi:MAG TPA: FAD:protein FMN transferase, partial [Terriglobales bacterium]|nr:FAD:protein FMN transferase [Terriglobales bacterium]